MIKKINPASGELSYEWPISSNAEVLATLERAEVAFLQWKKISLNDRIQCFERLVPLLLDSKEELAKIDCEDTGRPLRELLEVDLQSGIDNIHHFIQEKKHLQADLHDRFRIERVPYGVTLGLGACNYPLQIALWKMIPALLSGNTMIFVPSDLTVRSAVKLEQLVLAAGFPRGVFSVLVGGKVVASPLLQSGKIKLISLTGSTQTAEIVASTVAKNYPTQLYELGGKSPLIILPDADPMQAAKIAVLANFYSCGQVCSNATRVFLPKNLAALCSKYIVEFTEKIKIGHPMDLSTEFGPQISAKQRDHALGVIDEAVKAGAKILTGDAPLEDAWGKGFYMRPYVLSELQDQMRVVFEELFAPVMSLLTYESEAEVIDRANKTPYGLAAGIVGSNLQACKNLAEELDVGTVWINDYNLTPVGMPFGGVKASGRGRENSWHALLDYTQLKSIYIS